MTRFQLLDGGRKDEPVTPNAEANGTETRLVREIPVLEHQYFTIYKVGERYTVRKTDDEKVYDVEATELHDVNAGDCNSPAMEIVVRFNDSEIDGRYHAMYYQFVPETGYLRDLFPTSTRLHPRTGDISRAVARYGLLAMVATGIAVLAVGKHKMDNDYKDPYRLVPATQTSTKADLDAVQTDRFPALKVPDAVQDAEPTVTP